MSQSRSKNFDALIFDLDDTLLETTKLLTHPAFEYAFKIMAKNGLTSSLEQCFLERANTVLQFNRDEFLVYLVSKYTAKSDFEECLRIGQKAFQDKTLELEIFVTRSTLETLRKLSDDYPLFLVTAGARPTQMRKVEILEIACFLQHCFYVETKRKERKREAFTKIVETLKCQPERLLSIGNRLDLEIAEAKLLGLKTCHVLIGEYSHLTPRTTFEFPDYTISQISEITNVCQL